MSSSSIFADKVAQEPPPAPQSDSELLAEIRNLLSAILAALKPS